MVVSANGFLSFRETNRKNVVFLCLQNVWLPIIKNIIEISVKILIFAKDWKAENMLEEDGEGVVDEEGAKMRTHGQVFSCFL